MTVPAEGRGGVFLSHQGVAIQIHPLARPYLMFVQSIWEGPLSQRQTNGQPVIRPLNLVSTRARGAGIPDRISGPRGTAWAVFSRIRITELRQTLDRLVVRGVVSSDIRPDRHGTVRSLFPSSGLTHASRGSLILTLYLARGIPPKRRVSRGPLSRGRGTRG